MRRLVSILLVVVLLVSLSVPAFASNQWLTINQWPGDISQVSYQTLSDYVFDLNSGGSLDTAQIVTAPAEVYDIISSPAYSNYIFNCVQIWNSDLHEYVYLCDSYGYLYVNNITPRRQWLDKYNSDFVDDGSNLDIVDPDSSLFLSYSSVDSSGNTWYLINGLDLSVIESSWPETLVISNTSSDNTIKWTGGISYGSSSNALHSRTPNLATQLSTLSLPFTANYTIYAKTLISSYVTTATDYLFDCFHGFGPATSAYSLTGSPSCLHEYGTYPVASGGSLSPSLEIYYGVRVGGKSVSFSVRTQFYLVVQSAVVENPVSQIGTISGDLYVVGDDNSPVVYNNVQLVDGDNNKFYNLQTSEWITYESYAYDYSTYTYTFYNGDNVYNYTYGDEKIVYAEKYTENGDIVENTYNYYYGDGTSSGGGSGGNDGDNSGSGLWDWIKDRLGNALGGLIDALMDWLIEIIKTLLDALWAFIKGLAGFFLDSLDGISDVVKQFFDFLSDDEGGIFNFDNVTY